MRRTFAVCVFSLAILLPGSIVPRAPVYAQQTPEPAALIVKLPEKLSAPIGAWVIVPAEVLGGGGRPKWRVRTLAGGGKLDEVRLDTLFPDDVLAKAKGKVYSSQTPGVYLVEAWSAKDSEPSDIAACEITIGDAPAPAPGPPKPEPPTPPTPPGPKPADNAPIPLPGLRVLIVFETADVAKYPREQYAMLYSQPFRDWLNQKCVAGESVKEWRIFDQNISVAGDARHWQDAMKRERKALPWIVVSNGKTGFEGPLPATAQATKELIDKYASGVTINGNAGYRR